MSGAPRAAWLRILFALFVVLGTAGPLTAGAAPSSSQLPVCAQKAGFCADTDYVETYAGAYVGHDEPSLLFYSNTPGSGNSSRYTLTLPTDPPTAPNQNGTGGTDNFQLHPAFWFGMALCDSQSAPEYTTACAPDTDANIFDNPNPSAPDYMGHHPGTAFMEMQFYPPGWVLWPSGDSCDATKWCAALNIDSFSENMNTGQENNLDCLNRVGIEPVNFAFVTTSGVSQAPADPLDATTATYTPDPTRDLFMNSGDSLSVNLLDTANGFQVVITDLTTGQTGSMTASSANGFGQVVFDPTATTCSVNPYDFHPMYSTSSEHTRVIWAAHSYNVAFSDEIGHFEYCNAVSAEGGICTADGVGDLDRVSTGPKKDDDTYCFDAAASSLVPVAGCFGTDIDFDGVPYQDTWPGTGPNPTLDASLHAAPIRFTSPTFNGGTQNYDRIAFEADLPRIELSTAPKCDRNTGNNCVNPPPGAQFYPLFSTTSVGGQCTWQLGGTGIPGTIDTFGGSSTAEFGPLLLLTYPSVPKGNTSTVSHYNDFRQVLSSNPCPAS